MFLAIDQGNTSLKATWIGCQLFEKGVGSPDVIGSCRFDSSDVNGIFALMGDRNINSVGIVSTGRIDRKLVDALRYNLGDGLMLLTHDTPLPIGIRYATPQTLGLDRIAAMAGAVMLYPDKPLLVVDAGTAITLDVADGAGCFAGGNIAPGLELRLRSLHEATAALPLVGLNGDIPSFGYDTESAIRSGAVRGAVQQICASAYESKSIYGCRQLIFTGGDAEILMPLVDKYFVYFPHAVDDGCIECKLESNLVAIGLLSIYKYNETNI